MNANINDLLLQVQDFIKNKKYREAKNIINKILKIDNQCDKAYYFLSSIEYFLGNINESISALDNIHGLKECKLDKSYILFVRGRLYSEELHNYELAIDSFSKAIELNPNVSDIYFYRGKTKQLALSVQKGVNWNNIDASSLEDLSKAIELSPNKSEPYSYRGGSYFLLKKYSLALQDWNKYIELEPDDESGYCNRAYVKFEMEDYQGAIIDYTKSISLFDKDSSIYFSRGIAKCALEDYLGAKQDYELGMKIANNKESYLSKELKSKLNNNI